MSAPIEVRLSPAGDPMSDPTVVRDLYTKYLMFDSFVAGARRVDLHPLVLSSDLHLRAVETAESVVRTLSSKVAERAFHDPSERERYGFSAEVTRLAASSYWAGDVSSLVRVDLLLGSDLVWRVCEVNADCPGGHNESYGLPRMARAAGFVDAMNPTNAVEALVARIESLVRESGQPGAVALTYATAYAEDLQVCALLRRMLEERGTRAILAPPTAARRRDDGRLYIAGEPISVLYRFYPTEWMEGQRNLGEIASAIEDGRVRSMSSFGEMYLQSKLVMARAWALRDRLDEPDAAWIERAVPETFDLADLTESQLLADAEGWVIKRTLGRVGDDVFVGGLMPPDAWAGLVAQVKRLRDAGDRWIVQRFLPQYVVDTPWGGQLVTLGAYVLDGVFAGYYARVTEESHVSHDALCLPVFAEQAA